MVRDVKRIDLFKPVKGPYQLIHYFTEQLSQALERAGVQTRILESVYNNPKMFVDKIMSNPPDCTLSFNGLLPDDEGRFFAEMIQIPHLACLSQSAPHFVPLIKSPLNIIACNDRFDCDFFQGLNFNNTLFMSQGADIHMQAGGATRIYDVVMLATLIDYMELSRQWEEKYPPLVVQLLRQSAELVLKKKNISCVQALVLTIDDFVKGPVLFNLNSLDMIHALIEIENYVNGKNQAELIRAIKDARVHIFGEAPTTTSWKKFISDNSNVIIHQPVPFAQAIEIIRQAKIVLNSNASMKNGGSEIVFAGLASGALVLTPENLYLRQSFKDGENIVFYQPGNWDEVNTVIDFYLAESNERQGVAEAGRVEVMRAHTWDSRVQALLPELSLMLDKMKTAT